MKLNFFSIKDNRSIANANLQNLQTASILLGPNNEGKSRISSANWQRPRKWMVIATNGIKLTMPTIHRYFPLFPALSHFYPFFDCGLLVAD